MVLFLSGLGLGFVLGIAAIYGVLSLVSAEAQCDSYEDWVPRTHGNAQGKV